MTRAPFRFLLTILLLWTCARAAILLPGWPEEIGPSSAAARQRPVATEARASVAAAGGAAPQAGATAVLAGPARFATPRPPALASSAERPRAAPLLTQLTFILPGGRSGAKAGSTPAPWTAFSAQPPRVASSRWSASAWILLRDEGEGTALSPGGILGGSQAGTRITFAPGDGLALSGRAYLPLRRTTGAELAAGVDWRPVASLPVGLLAERRQRLGREGRNAFALTLYGGTSRSFSPRTRLDLYGQAGMVGLRARDLFADGAARLSRRVGPVELGAGLWGAAQPGAARLDAGPSLSWRLPVRDANLRLQADWRIRIAGDAAPGSGPALTLAADF